MQMFNIVLSFLMPTNNQKDCIKSCYRSPEVAIMYGCPH